MNNAEKKEVEYLDQIELLLEEAYALPKQKASAPRRAQINEELTLLIQRIADLHDNPFRYAGA